MKPKILYVIGQLTRGGAERQLFYLLRALQPEACVVSLAEGGYWADPISGLGVSLVELPRRGHWEWRRLWGVVAAIRAFRPDVIHVFSDSVSGLYGRLAALLTRHPCVIVGERRHPSLDVGWYSWLKWLVLNRLVTACVTNAVSSQEYMVGVQGAPAGQTFYIPNGIMVEAFSAPRPGAKATLLPSAWQDKLVVGMVCGMRPKKRIDQYLHLARQILAKKPDVRFLHVGDGPEYERLLALHGELQLGDRFRFVGAQENVAEWLNALDVFVLTSSNEGMPNAVMEAMAVGLPCVVTDVGDCGVLVEQGRTGFVAPAGALPTLIQHTQHLLENPALRAQMGQAGQAAIADYSIERMAQRYDKLYTTLLAKHD